MNTHSLNETMRRFLIENLPGVSIHTPVSNGELSTPYVLLSCVADEVLIPGNNTWKYSMELSLHSAAHDETEASMREQFTTLCALLGKKSTCKSVNEVADDFILYSLSLRGIEAPQTQDNDFIQTATFRVVIQF